MSRRGPFRGLPKNEPVDVTYMAARRIIVGVPTQTMDKMMHMRSYFALENGGRRTRRHEAEHVAALLCCVVDDFARPPNEIDIAFLGTIRQLLVAWGLITGEDTH